MNKNLKILFAVSLVVFILFSIYYDPNRKDSMENSATWWETLIGGYCAVMIFMGMIIWLKKDK